MKPTKGDDDRWQKELEKSDFLGEDRHKLKLKLVEQSEEIEELKAEIQRLQLVAVYEHRKALMDNDETHERMKKMYLDYKKESDDQLALTTSQRDWAIDQLLDMQEEKLMAEQLLETQAGLANSLLDEMKNLQESLNDLLSKSDEMTRELEALKEAGQNLSKEMANQQVLIKSEAEEREKTMETAFTNELEKCKDDLKAQLTEKDREIQALTVSFNLRLEIFEEKCPQCHICMKNLAMLNSQEKKVILTACGHLFCLECISEARMVADAAGQTPGRIMAERLPFPCPACRTHVKNIYKIFM